MPDFTALTDADLVEHARENPDAFTALYHRYLTPLYRYLYRRLNNVHDAEDITAQVFIDVLEGLVNHTYHEGGCFSAWLFTIAHHRLVDFYRQHASTALLDDPLSTESGLLEGMERVDDMHHLAELLTQLDDDKQELLRLRFSAGLSFSEIGLLKGRSEAAIKMALYRAIEFLRDHWEVKNG
jgi:RNA polymerase sigma-70 factor (ECF subfamily)